MTHPVTRSCPDALAGVPHEPHEHTVTREDPRASGGVREIAAWCEGIPEPIIEGSETL